MREGTRIFYVSEDEGYFSRLGETCSWAKGVLVTPQESARVLGVLGPAERAWVIVDWQINAAAGISPGHLLSLVKDLSRRGVTVAVVAKPGFVGPRWLVQFMEAGAVSFTERTHDLKVFADWLNDFFALPWRGYWPPVPTS